MIIALIGAPGTGKDTTIKIIKEQLNYDISKAISWTTRPMRENDGIWEKEGVDYYFIKPWESVAYLERLFIDSVASDFHREHFYGVLKDEFEKDKLVWC